MPLLALALASIALEAQQKWLA